MCLGHTVLSVGVDVLDVSWPSAHQDNLYDQQSRRLRHTPPHLRASRVAFFYDSLTQLGRHLVHIAAMHVQLVGNVVIRQIESHEIQTQSPHVQGLMMSCKDGVGQIIKTCVTVGTLLALACRFCVIKAAHDGLFGLARWTFDALRPA
jgi:hypothetical protein